MACSSCRMGCSECKVAAGFVMTNALKDKGYNGYAIDVPSVTYLGRDFNKSWSRISITNLLKFINKVFQAKSELQADAYSRAHLPVSSTVITIDALLVLNGLIGLHTTQWGSHAVALFCGNKTSFDDVGCSAIGREQINFTSDSLLLLLKTSQLLLKIGRRTITEYDEEEESRDPSSSEVKNQHLDTIKEYDEND
ncbi:hypothetical protein Tco_0614992 [Tanacetum coccineum]